MQSQRQLLLRPIKLILGIWAQYATLNVGTQQTYFCYILLKLFANRWIDLFRFPDKKINRIATNEEHASPHITAVFTTLFGSFHTEHGISCTLEQRNNRSNCDHFWFHAFQPWSDHQLYDLVGFRFRKFHSHHNNGAKLIYAASRSSMGVEEMKK